MNPLVPSGRDLDAAQRRRSARHLLLDGFGPAAQARLAAARVLVVGAGGLGSPVLQYLAAAGVGTLGVVDDDVVEPSNLQRQVLHGARDVGARKTASAAASLRALRSDLEVVEHPVRLTAENAEGLLAGYHLVVDACDTFETRYAIGDAAARLGLPVVWGTVLGWDGQVSVWWSAAPEGALTYRDVFGDQPAEGESCATAGVLAPACGVVGSTMAVEAVKLLTGTGAPTLGRLLTYDARTSTWDTIPLTPPRETEPAERETEPARSVSRVPGSISRVPGSISRGLVVDVGLAPAVDGGVWVRLEDLAAGELPPALGDHPYDAPLVVVCEQGLRSRGAAAILRDDGWTDVTATTYAALTAPRGRA